MNSKRFCQKVGYDGTVQRLLNNQPFIRGMMRESMDNQTMELLCQFEICRQHHGYYERYCHQTKRCIGVPFCTKQQQKVKEEKATP